MSVRFLVVGVAATVARHALPARLRGARGALRLREPERAAARVASEPWRGAARGSASSARAPRRTRASTSARRCCSIRCRPRSRTWSAAGEADAETRIERDEPEHVAIRTRGANPAVLVLNDALYPGWEATLDGVALRCCARTPRSARCWCRRASTSSRCAIGRARSDAASRSRGVAVLLLAVALEWRAHPRRARSAGLRRGDDRRAAAMTSSSSAAATPTCRCCARSRWAARGVRADARRRPAGRGLLGHGAGLRRGPVPPRELEIDVRPLARRAGGARGRGAPRRRVDAGRAAHRARGPRRARPTTPRAFDVGSTVARARAARRARARRSPTRPIGALRRGARCGARACARRAAALRVAVVGARRGGVELAFALEARLRPRAASRRAVTLVERRRACCRAARRASRRAASRARPRAAASRCGCGARVVAASSGRALVGEAASGLAVRRARLGDRRGAAARCSPTPRSPNDARGFVRVRADARGRRAATTLFAAGDCARFDTRPSCRRPASTRCAQGPILDAQPARAPRGPRAARATGRSATSSRC